MRVLRRRLVVVGDALIADGSVAEDEAARREIGLQATGGPDTDESAGSERDQLLEGRCRGRGADAELATEGDLRQILEPRNAIEAVRHAFDALAVTVRDNPPQG